jgi:hypothetical protein
MAADLFLSVFSYQVLTMLGDALPTRRRYALKAVALGEFTLPGATCS